MAFKFNALSGRFDLVDGGISQATADTRYLQLSGGTMTGDIVVPDEAYGAGWDGSLEVPTKNALYDKIQTLGGPGASTALDNLASVAINTSLISDTDSTDDLGSSSKYWANGYVDKVFLNSTATLDGSTAGKVSIGGGVSIIVPNSGNVDALYIEQNDTTNNPKAVYIKNLSTGEAFRFEQNGALANSKTCFAIYSNQVNVGTDSYLLKIENDNASASIPVSFIRQDGTGVNLILENTNTGGDSHVLQMRLPSGAGAKFIEALTNFSTMFTVNNDGVVNAAGSYQVDGTQVVGNRVVDARIDDTINTSAWDSDTAGVLDAIRDAMISHGLMAAA